VGSEPPLERRGARLLSVRSLPPQRPSLMRLMLRLLSVRSLPPQRPSLMRLMLRLLAGDGMTAAPCHGSQRMQAYPGLQTQPSSQIAFYPDRRGQPHLYVIGTACGFVSSMARLRRRVPRVTLGGVRENETQEEQRWFSEFVPR